METGSQLFQKIWIILEASPDKVIHYKQYGILKWKPILNRQYQSDIISTILFLKENKLQKNDSICLILPTCYEWDVIEKASFFLGLNLISIDPRQKKSFLNNSLAQSSKMIVVKDQLDINVSKLVNLSELPILKSNKLESLKVQFDFIDSFDDLIAYTIFTSGSTGEPKALTYTQRQIQDTVEKIVKLFDGQIKNEITLAWLPIANPFQRIFNLISIFTKACVYFEEDPQNVMKSLRKIKPTVLISIPYFFEKIKTNIQNILKNKFLFKYIADGPVGDFLEASLLKYLLGNRLKFCISGSAALQVQTQLYFKKNINILEAYGLSESILPVAINTLNNWKLGSVGKLDKTIKLIRL